METIRAATPQQALKHPNWSMGAKVTIDSATLMNKGLELIEAHHLFAMPSEQIEFSFIRNRSCMGWSSFGTVPSSRSSGRPTCACRSPIAWRGRSGFESAATRLDWSKVANLSFEKPDLERFPALALARAALEAGGAAPTVLNAANEIAVAEFLAGRLGFAAIPALVEATLEAAARSGLSKEPASVEDALSVDHVSRSLASGSCPKSRIKAS